MIFAGEIDSAVSSPECEFLASFAYDKRVLELGSWKGRSTVALASVATQVMAVDWHEGDPHAGTGGHTLQELKDHLGHYKLLDRVIILVARFEEVLPQLQRLGVEFDFVFIDGYHTHEAVAQDSEMSLPLLVKGGSIAWHDYGRNLANFGVTSAVDEFVQRHGLTKLGQRESVYAACV